MIDRTSGKSKYFIVDNVKASTLLPILRENIAKEAIDYTDEAKHYGSLGSELADHDFTNHSKGNYVRGDVHTITLEGYFSIFKRGMKGRGSRGLSDQ